MFQIIIPVIAILATSIIAFSVAKNRQKVDRGFALNYYSLSYRRKFIRSLFGMPILILSSLVIYILAEWPVMLKNAFTISFLIIGILQIMYNYKMWKKDETIS